MRRTFPQAVRAALLLRREALQRALAVLASMVCLGGAALAATGCTPAIGDKCVLSTDCSLQGDRLCDTSEPGGYCTILNCRGNLCPDNAACVLFHPTIQGCSYNDRSPSRTGRTFCVKTCGDNSDCRPGYVCEDPRRDPWQAIILDDNQAEKVCIVPESSATGGGSGQSSTSEAPVCQASSPDAGPIDASPPDAGDAASDGSSDGAAIGDSAADASGGDGGIVDAGTGG